MTKRFVLFYVPYFLDYKSHHKSMRHEERKKQTYVRRIVSQNANRYLLQITDKLEKQVRQLHNSTQHDRMNRCLVCWCYSASHLHKEHTWTGWNSSPNSWSQSTSHNLLNSSIAPNNSVKWYISMIYKSYLTVRQRNSQTINQSGPYSPENTVTIVA